MLTIGIDVGGTFTDLVAIDEAGRTVFAKSPSTPQDQSIGVMAGLDELARRLDLSRADMLASRGVNHHAVCLFDRGLTAATTSSPGATTKDSSRAFPSAAPRASR